MFLLHTRCRGDELHVLMMCTLNDHLQVEIFAKASSVVFFILDDEVRFIYLLCNSDNVGFTASILNIRLIL